MFPTLGLAPGYSLTVMKAARKFKELEKVPYIVSVSIGMYIIDKETITM